MSQAWRVKNWILRSHFHTGLVSYGLLLPHIMISADLDRDQNDTQLTVQLNSLSGKAQSHLFMLHCCSTMFLQAVSYHASISEGRS